MAVWRWLTVAVGVSLLVLDVAGLLVTPARHPKAAQPRVHRVGLTLTDASETERRLEQSLTIHDPEERLKALTAAMAAGIVHHWPQRGRPDADVLFGFAENWIIAGQQRLELWLNGPADLNLALLERRDYRRILAKGVGFCSQVSMALADYLDRNGIAADIVGLQGHVAAAVELEGRSYILDSDYNVVLPFGLEHAAGHGEEVAGYYRAAGWREDQVAKVVAIYGQPKRRQVALAHYRAGDAGLIGRAEILKWAIPFGLLGLALVPSPRRRRDIAQK